MTNLETMTIRVDGDQTVSAIWQRPQDAWSTFVFAHGAGAGMTHAFMAAFADGLVARRIAVLRYQFPFIERGSKRPDGPALAQATVRAAVASATALAEGLPTFVGGKSFGGRMASQAEAAEPLADVAGLVFVGFPLHPAGKPAIARAEHLSSVRRPMLFLQGTRDDLADLALLRPVVARLGDRATLHVIDDADHAFHVRRASGRDDVAVHNDLLDVTGAWMRASATTAPLGKH